MSPEGTAESWSTILSAHYFTRDSKEKCAGTLVNSRSPLFVKHCEYEYCPGSYTAGS